MIKEVISYLVEQVGAMETVTIHGERAFVGCGKVLQPGLAPAPPKAKPVQLSTLQGFARWMAFNIDDIDAEKHLVVVDSPSSVSLISQASSPHRHRETLIQATYEDPGFRETISRTWPCHELAARLGSLFEKTEERDALIILLTNIKTTESKVQSAKGLGWRASAESEIGGDGWESVEGPVPTWSLRPYRSFPEAVTQQASVFTIPKPEIRDDGVYVRLVACDGEAWRPKAIETVGSALESLYASAMVAAGLTDDQSMPSIVW